MAEPFAAEAKYFVESRLLNRDVHVLLEGVDKYNNFYGTIQHPAGNISQELLKVGLAKVVDWSAKFAKVLPLNTLLSCAFRSLVPLHGLYMVNILGHSLTFENVSRHVCQGCRAPLQGRAHCQGEAPAPVEGLHGAAAQRERVGELG